MNRENQLMFLIAFFLCGQLGMVVEGGTSSLIAVFEVQCSDGSLCPRNVTLATADKAAGRPVADQCCVYFRDGCCTQQENQELTKLFQLTLGLCIGIPLLVVMVILLSVCLLVYCKLRYTPESEKKNDIFKSHSKSSSLEYWHSNEGYTAKTSEKALFHY
jgi:hypothetical protein